MTQLFSQRVLSVVIGVFALLQARCTFPDSSESGSAPPLSLQGRWRLDSGNVTFYNGRGQFLHRLQDNARERAPGFITIGPERWHYFDGRHRAAYSYVRQGNTLVVFRLADTALVRGGHAQWKDMGKPLGLPDTSVIAVLTPHSWLRLDSTKDPDGSLIRVFRNYYSR